MGAVVPKALEGSPLLPEKWQSAAAQAPVVALPVRGVKRRLRICCQRPPESGGDAPPPSAIPPPPQPRHPVAEAREERAQSGARRTSGKDAFARAWLWPL